MMDRFRFFIFGAGYSGRAIARAALAEGHFAAGTTREQEKAQRLQRDGIQSFLFDGQALPDEALKALDASTHLVISIAPGAADPVLAACADAIMSASSLRWIGYLSTVGVYGDHQGEWVDETNRSSAQDKPLSQRSQERIKAEEGWSELGERIAKPVALLRLSGIYGPGRNAFVNLETKKVRRIVKSGQVFNRIHVDDIAGALMMLARHEAGGIFNITDDEPAPPQDVVTYAASIMGIEPPPEIPFEQADMSPMARSFYGENKRVSNARIKALGYQFRFSDYRVALDHLWRGGYWDKPL